MTAAESMILGTSAKMRTIVGPVIVYGVSASVVYGLIGLAVNTARKGFALICDSCNIASFGVQ